VLFLEVSSQHLDAIVPIVLFPTQRHPTLPERSWVFGISSKRVETERQQADLTFKIKNNASP